MTDYYQKMFIRDTQDFLKQLSPLLARMESRTADLDDIDTAFRIMHSIKSEAAHLRKKSVADVAHIAESVLQELRGEPKNERHLNRLFDALSRIEAEFSSELSTAAETPLSQDESLFPGETHGEISDHQSEGFSDFELLLLAEARDRGETFYRMICEFEDPTEMLYPKAVLILNNLEQIVNVIRCKPDLSQAFDGHGIAPEYYFTTDRPETDLFNAVKVDQVQRVFLARLNMDQHLLDVPSTQNRAEEGRRESQLLITRIALVSLWFHYLQTRIQIHPFDSSGKQRQPKMLESMTGISEALQATRFVTFEAGFHDFADIVQRSAAEQGKEARCSIHGGEQSIERWFSSRLRNSLVQLLRNAVSHGIEEPSVRLKAGKSPRGEVSLLYRRDEQSVNIYIQDDGRGIDEDTIRAKAIELGLDSSAPLLNIIMSPGFSTSETISLEAGRGIGLDIVAAEIARIPGAEFKLESKEHQGAQFCISIPQEASCRILYFARYKQHTLAVDSTVFLGHEKPQHGKFHHDEQGRVRYRDSPVYTCEGYLFWSDNFVPEDILIKIRTRDETSYLLVEELLFKEILPEDLVSLSDTEEGVLLPQLCVGEHKTGISFLHGDDIFHSDRLGKKGP